MARIKIAGKPFHSFIKMHMVLTLSTLFSLLITGFGVGKESIIMV